MWFDIAGSAFSTWKTWHVLVLVGSLVVVVIVCLYFWRKHKESKQYNIALSQLRQHSHTILICASCSGRDVQRVSRQLAAAVELADSPLRIKFAIVQAPGSNADVYDVLLDHLKYATSVGSKHYFVDKIKTVNVSHAAFQQGFFKALTMWQQLVSTEFAVLIMDPNVQVVRGWDVALCAAVRSMEHNGVVSAFEPASFCVFVRKQLNHLASRPAAMLCLEARRFAMQPSKSSALIVPSLATSTSFAAFHAQHFKALPAHACVDANSKSALTFSDYVYQANCSQYAFSQQLFTLQGVQGASTSSCFIPTLPTLSSEPQAQLSQPYLKYIGVNIVLNNNQSSSNENSSDNNSSDNSFADYVLSSRAMLGVTPAAWQYIHNQNDAVRGIGQAECIDKYGTRSDAERQLRLSTWTV